MINMMEELYLSPSVVEGGITSVQFSVAEVDEINKFSGSGFNISHPGQLSNAYLGLPVESGKCDSCGASEHGKCEGHFGFIRLPIPIYTPQHIGELKRILSLICFKCLRMIPKKISPQDNNTTASSCSYCEDVPRLSIQDAKNKDGAVSLELKMVGRNKLRDVSWKFMDRYGYSYREDSEVRPLLPYEALRILDEIPVETKKKLSAKNYYPQSGLVMKCLPVPPNCLSVPNVSDGVVIMSSDLSISMLRKLLQAIENIKRSRSGTPNFESHLFEATELQKVVSKYMDLRGRTQTPQDKKGFLTPKEAVNSSSKIWLEKIRNLFIRKSSSFSSRSVITGDAFRGINEIGLPREIAERMTIEERVTAHNIGWLQKMVDERRCIMYKDGFSSYAIKVGSKGDKFLKIGQVVQRPIVDGDIVFVNRPPSTHKHSLQALSVYIHEDHVVKINPLICAPFGADFDGDCVHIFYPQSLSAKSEAQELFAVENQLFSSHTGSLNLQFVNDSLLSLRLFFNSYFLNRTNAQQLMMSAMPVFPVPAVIKSADGKPQWSVLQVLQTALPADFDSSADNHLIRFGEILKLDCYRDSPHSLFAEVVTSMVKIKDSGEAVKFLNLLQPLLMEMLFSHGFSVDLEDFVAPSDVIRDMKRNVDYASRGFRLMGLNYNEYVASLLETDFRNISHQVVSFLLSSSLGKLIDSKSKSSISKVAEQLAFLGLQLYGKGRLYSSTLIENILLSFQRKYSADKVPLEAFGIVSSSFFEGLNPFEELVHVISARDAAIRSTRGLTEPGTLFKKLMAILRDVVVCYDGTVRNICSNSVVLFKYEATSVSSPMTPAGEPVGVLAATAVSNPSYKAVLDSSPSNTNTWQLMQEVLLCNANFTSSKKQKDKRVILFLDDCPCGKKFCRENAAYTVQNHLKRVSLRDLASEFIIEYQRETSADENLGTNAGLVGHIHLNEKKLMELQCGFDDIFNRCQELVNDNMKGRKKFSQLFKKVHILRSGSCGLQHPDAQNTCLRYWYDDETNCRSIKEIQGIMADVVFPALLDTVVKGDQRISAVNIIWTDLDSTIWKRNQEKMPKGEIALELVISKDVVKNYNDAWRVAMDACLPVMHLIDSTRSIPYGVKQIQELYGISFAFEESVQRLFTSINSVSKGILKEHLILVVSCMSCTGNLCGFNNSGYKALLKSLDIEVPFTSATITTPMRCFERAAEKCHVDTLSSIVASCAWGKRTTVGTGARFEILWDKNMISSQEINENAFDILQMVRPTRSAEVGSDCLFDGDYDLLEEREKRALDLSPEHNLEFEPVFEDIVENQSNWQSDTGATDKLSEDGWNSWKPNHEQNSVTAAEQNSNGWDSWNTSHKEKSEAEPNSDGWDPWKTNDKEKSAKPSEVKESSGNEWNIWNESSVDNPTPSFHPSNNEDAWGLQSSKEQTTSNGWKRPRAENMSSPNVVPSKNQESWNATAEADDSWDRGKVDGNAWNNHAIAEAIGSWDNGKADSDARKNPGIVVVNDSWDNGKADGNPWKNPGIVDVKDSFGHGKEEGGDWNNHSIGEADGTWDHGKAGDDAWNNHAVGKADDSWNSGKTDGKAWKNRARSPFHREESSEGPTASPKNFAAGWKKNTGPPRNNTPTTHLTATRRRMDQFGAEEIEMLKDVDPKILTVKDIVQKYSNGDRFSDDDQSFVLENVFNYHPNKSEKMVPNLDFVTVDEATGHSGSRCFYLVSNDGTKEDFSYLKCMKNYVEVTYPDKAEGFISKYFRSKDPAPPSPQH